MRAIGLVLLLSGCIDGVTQVAGVGATYTTRCSAWMEPKDSEFVARCTPASCDIHFESVAVNQVVVAFDPGEKVLGYAERVCLQDLSNASALFQPELDPQVEKSAPEAKSTTP